MGKYTQRDIFAAQENSYKASKLAQKCLDDFNWMLKRRYSAKEYEWTKDAVEVSQKRSDAAWAKLQEMLAENEKEAP